MISFIDQTNICQQNFRILTNRYSRRNKLSQQLSIVNDKTIIADFCTYRFTEHMLCFTTLTRFSIIFYTSEFVFYARNAKRLSIAM